jgi:hypothetical protein
MALHYGEQTCYPTCRVHLIQNPTLTESAEALVFRRTIVDKFKNNLLDKTISFI